MAAAFVLMSSFPVSTWAQNGFLWPDGKKAALSLTFDDARESHPDLGLPLFRRLDLDVTYYVIPGGVQGRVKEWKEIIADGHEIGNHTVVHPCSGNFSWARDKALESYTLTSMRHELLDANRQLEEMLGITPVSFAYTCGQTFVGRGKSTMSYVPVVAELFESGRGWMNEAANDPLFFDFAQVQGVEMDGKNFKEILPLLENAIANNLWLVLAGHEIGEGGRQTTRIAMLEDLAEYLKTEGRDIWISTVGEIASYVKMERGKVQKSLGDHLTFYSSFDQGTDADFSRGNRSIFTSSEYNSESAGQAGIHTDDISIAENEGRYGNALSFEKKIKEVVWYEAPDNINYKEEAFGGSISLWLSLDPEKDLEPGYCDPIQITDVGYNDAAFWVDFSDKNPRLFRMGVFGDLEIWNPKNIGPDDNPDFQERLVVAEDRPFGNDIWTHVVIAFEKINGRDAKALFYVNGKPQGERMIPESFTWEVKRAKIYLGLNYVGLMDEVAIFDKPLSEEEVQMLYLLEGGVRDLRE